MDALMTTGMHEISALIGTSAKSLEKCIGKIEHQHCLKEIDASTHLHFLRFDGNGEPMVKALAEVMYTHIIDYCLASRERVSPISPHEAARLTKRARRLFIHPDPTPDDPDQTGEAGELLLYLLIEAILQAPQVVAKMELKTNPKLEVNGSDGIHMAWNESESLVELFFGEAKIYQDIGAAIKASLTSIDGFHANGICRHEMLMVTQHFKYANAAVKEVVDSLLTDGVPTSGVRINHVCLIGFNWAEYKAIFGQPANARLDALKAAYLKAASKIHDLCDERLKSFASRHVRLTFFFIPFVSVQAFRDAFNEALD